MTPRNPADFMLRLSGALARGFVAHLCTVSVEHGAHACDLTSRELLVARTSLIRQLGDSVEWGGQSTHSVE